MSRLGKVPIPLPDKVKISVSGSRVTVEGPKGKLEESLIGGVGIRVEQKGVLVDRPGDARADRSAQGLIRRLMINMIEGVTKGFSKTLEINGVG